MNPKTNPERDFNIFPHALPGRTSVFKGFLKSVKLLFTTGTTRPAALRAAEKQAEVVKDHAVTHEHRAKAPQRHTVAAPSATQRTKQAEPEEQKPKMRIPRASLRIVNPAKKAQPAPDAEEASAPEAVAAPPVELIERPTVKLAEKATAQKSADVIDEGETWMSKVVGKKADQVLNEDAFTVLRRWWGVGQSAKVDKLIKVTSSLTDEQKERLQKEEEQLHEQSGSDAFLNKVQLKQDTKEASAQSPAEQREASFRKHLEEQKTAEHDKSDTTKKTPVLKADELRSETAAAKEGQPKGKIVKPDAAQQTVPQTAPTLVRKQVQKAHGGFAGFLASLSHFGLGKERTMFIQNLGTMLGAGLALVDSLNTLQRETRTKSMKKLIQRITENVESGRPLWRAMDDEYFFTPHAIALVRIGEESGDLAQNVVYLAEQEEKDAALRGKVKMAMIYPTIVMVLMFIIVMGLGMFVLPQLIGVLLALNVPLPLTTRMLIAFTNAFTNYGYIFIPGTIAGFILLIILSKFTNFKIVTQWAMFHTPGIGALAKEATIARFGVILGGLLRAGVPVVESISSLARVTPIVTYRKFYERLLEHVSQGDSFAKSFAIIKKSEKLLPPSVQQLVMTGERSGALADIMLKIADIYDKKASSTAEKLPVVLEPILLLFIGALVAIIAFSIIVPIYSIVGNVGQG